MLQSCQSLYQQISLVITIQKKVFDLSTKYRFAVIEENVKGQVIGSTENKQVKRLQFSGVTPMGSEGADPRAPGLRGHPGPKPRILFRHDNTSSVSLRKLPVENFTYGVGNPPLYRNMLHLGAPFKNSFK